MRSFSGTLLVCAGVVVIAASGCDGEGSEASRDPRQAAQSRPSGEESRSLNLTVVAIEARIGRDRVPSSGTVVDADRGLVLTSAHTVWGARRLRLATGLGVLHGRIVARAPCEGLALVETQPRLPGLVTLSPARDLTLRGGARLTLVGRGRGDPEAGSDELLTLPVTPRGATTRVRIDARLPRFRHALRLGDLAPESSGAPILDEQNRLVAMALTADGQGGASAAAAAIPASTILRRLGELRPGTTRLYRGWRRHYRCTPRLDAHARVAHPGFRPPDARLGAPVPATRLPGTEELNG